MKVELKVSSLKSGSKDESFTVLIDTRTKPDKNAKLRNDNKPIYLLPALSLSLRLVDFCASLFSRHRPAAALPAIQHSRAKRYKLRSTADGVR